MQLSYYRVRNFTKKIGAGACGSWYIDLAAVAKCNSAVAPYCVPNEVVCSDLGRFLRLPLPPAGIVYTPHLTDKFWFTCLDFTLSGNAPPPVEHQRCVDELTDLSTGLIVFDILIGNTDRHRGNLAVDFTTRTAPQMDVFDHSHALLGYAAGQGEATLRNNINALQIANHCLSGRLARGTFFGRWIDRVGQIPDYLIDEAAETTTTFGTTPNEAQAIIDFLKHRRDHIRDIINTNSGSFPSINPWTPV